MLDIGQGPLPPGALGHETGDQIKPEAIGSDVLCTHKSAIFISTLERTHLKLFRGSGSYFQTSERESEGSPF